MPWWTPTKDSRIICGVSQTSEGTAMNLTTVGIGMAAIGYGLYTAWVHRARPEQFRKLGPMKKFWGDTAGLAMHFFSYTVMPIIVGALLVLSGLLGGSVL